VSVRPAPLKKYELHTQKEKTMTDITKEMKKLIADNLPAATAGAMSDFIAEAKVTKGELRIANGRIKDQDQELEEKAELIKVLRMAETTADALEKAAKEVSDREKDVSIRERNISMEVMRVELNSANDRNATVERLVDKVFGHPGVKVTTQKEAFTAVDGGNDCCGFVDQRPTVEQKTTVETKS
jgi:hypothetical protein